MSDHTDDPPEVEPADLAVADLLRRERPNPAAGFRGALGRRLAALDPGYGPRPDHLRVIVAALVSAGALTILLGALTSAGAI